MSGKDVKTFKLKARGDSGAGKTQLLFAFQRFLHSFGMSADLYQDDHHLVVKTTKKQRVALYAFNRNKKQRKAAS